MRKIMLGLTLAASTTLLGMSAASAFPVAPIGATASPVEQARVVCNRWGRCWNTGPRYHRYGYYGPRRHWPGYYGGYYGGPYAYGGPYGYYGGPGIGIGVPGFGFRLGF